MTKQSWFLISLPFQETNFLGGDALKIHPQIGALPTFFPINGGSFCNGVGGTWVADTLIV